MKLEKIKLTSICPASYNPRKISEEDKLKLRNSIDTFGVVDPIIINLQNNKIIGGHQRYDTLLDKYMEDNSFFEELNLIRLGDVGWVFPDTDLKIPTEDHEKALNLALNKISGEWDTPKLEELLTELDLSGFGIELTGFDELDIGELDLELPSFTNEPTEVIEDDYEPEDDLEVTVELGDIYQLGNHRLMCGDSTKEKEVSLLMDGCKADMVFTDPPYNIDYEGIKDKRQIKNDKMDDDLFVEFLKNSLMRCETSYVCCSWQYSHLFKQAMEQIGMPPKAMIIWDKVNRVQNLDKYFKQHEIIYYYGKFGGETTIRGDIWQVPRQRNTVHPTMKPIELISLAIKDNPNKNNIYDGFGGSGSTLIACEQTGRNCFMMELDPKYCQVIINRWEEFTGEKAKKIN